MKIEIGKRYKTREGQTAFVCSTYWDGHINAPSMFSYVIVGERRPIIFHCYEDGRNDSLETLDLVECIDEPEEEITFDDVRERCPLENVYLNRGGIGIIFTKIEDGGMIYSNFYEDGRITFANENGDYVEFTKKSPLQMLQIMLLLKPKNEIDKKGE